MEELELTEFERGFLLGGFIVGITLVIITRYL